MFREQHLGEEIVQEQIIVLSLGDLQKKKEAEAKPQVIFKSTEKLQYVIK